LGGRPLPTDSQPRYRQDTRLQSDAEVQPDAGGGESVDAEPVRGVAGPHRVAVTTTNAGGANRVRRWTSAPHCAASVRNALVLQALLAADERPDLRDAPVPEPHRPLTPVGDEFRASSESELTDSRTEEEPPWAS
jgi:hypothetical protein